MGVGEQGHMEESKVGDASRGVFTYFIYKFIVRNIYTYILLSCIEHDKCLWYTTS